MLRPRKTYGRDLEKGKKEEELKAWETIKKSVLELEEKEGDWKAKGKNITNIMPREEVANVSRQEGIKEKSELEAVRNKLESRKRSAKPEYVYGSK